MAKANNVASVIAGEATSGTPEQRWSDMLAIASVVVNRARQLGVTPESVVSAVDPNGYAQFNAYNKELPPGVDEGLVDMAAQAMNYVEKYGPTTEATFYSTPKTQDNLPSGLVPDAQTAGHIYKTDPLDRSILTDEGYQTPTGEISSQLMGSRVPTPEEAFAGYLESKQNPNAISATGILGTNPGLSASATVGPFGGSILDAAPSSLATPYGATDFSFDTPAQDAISSILSKEAPEFSPVEQASMNVNPTGTGRPFPASNAINDAIQQSVTSVLGPDASVQVTSGQEQGLAQLGSNRHKTGLAADYTVKTPDGRQLSWRDPQDVEVMKDIAQSAATLGTNIGLGYENAPHMTHADLVSPSDFTAGQDASWGAIGNDPDFAAKLAEARSSALMPDSFYEKQAQSVLEKGIVPEARPTGILSTPSAINSPVSVSPLKDVNVSSFQDMAAAGPVSTTMANPGINSADMQAMKASVDNQLSQMAAQRAGTLGTALSLGSIADTVANAQQTPNFSQALTNALPSYSNIPSSYQAPMAAPVEVANVPGPANTEISTQTTTANPTKSAVSNVVKQAISQPVAKAPTQEAKKGLLSGLLTKESVLGGVLGTAALGPVGGILGGILGRQVANNGGVTGMLGNSPMSINNIGAGLQNVASVYGGAPVGTQAQTSNGGYVTSLPGGRTALTNKYGVTTVTDASGKQSSYFGSPIGNGDHGSNSPGTGSTGSGRAA